MNKHILGYGALILGLVVLAGAAITDHFHNAIEIAKVQAQIEGRNNQQKEDNSKLDELKRAKEEADARYVDSQKTLQKMTSLQIVQKAPQFITGIPASSRPITIFGAGVAPPNPGDAIIPQDQIKPIAAQILAGNNCINNQLPNCNQNLKIWQDKYTLRDQDAKDWEKLAKGGTFWHKMKRCGILGGIGFGAGAAVTASTPGPINQTKPILRNGAISGVAVTVPCLFIK